MDDDASTNGAGRDVRYSRNRLALLGAAWLLLALALIGTSPDLVAQAGHDCTSRPCQFPAGHYRGGYLMGVEEMYGTPAADDVPSSRTVYNNFGEEIPTAHLEVSDSNTNLTATNQTMYKQIKYDDPATADATDNFSIYIYQDFVYSPYMWQEVGEYAAAKFYGSKTFGSASAQDLWVANASEDTGCGDTEVCLDGSSTADNQELFDGIFRVHNVTGDDVYIDGMYLEVRWGTGWDRWHVYPFNSNYGGRSNDGDDSEVGWNDPINYGAPFVQNFTCDGNPTTSADCNLDFSKSTFNTSNIYWNASDDPDPTYSPRGQ